MDFNITNCRGCGTLFRRTGSDRLCPQCVKKLEEKFHEVRTYISENRGVSIMQVSREMDVSVDQIKAWIREDRLQLDEAGDPDFCCLQCGVPIRSGKYCDHCKGRVLNNLNSAYNKESVIPEAPKRNTMDDKNKMRFL